MELDYWRKGRDGAGRLHGGENKERKLMNWLAPFSVGAANNATNGRRIWMGGTLRDKICAPIKLLVIATSERGLRNLYKWIFLKKLRAKQGVHFLFNLIITD